MSFTIVSPQIYIKLIVEEGREFVFGDFSDKEVNLLSLSYSQMMSVAGPISAVVCVNQHDCPDLRHLINFGCLIEFWIIHPADSSHWCITTGLIHKVTRETDFSGTGGKPARQIFKIEAFEIGMLLKQTNLFLDITPAGKKFFDGTDVSNTVRASTGVRNTIQGIAHTIAERWLYDVYQAGKFKFKDGTTLKDRLVIDEKYFAEELWFNENLNFLQIWNWRASIWDLINSILSPPFHECFCIPSGHSEYKVGGRVKGKDGKTRAKTVNLCNYPHPIDSGKNGKKDIVAQDGSNSVSEKGRIFLIIRPAPYDDSRLLQKGEKMKKVIFPVTSGSEIVHMNPESLRGKSLYTSNEQMYSVYQLVIGNIPISEEIQKTIFAEPFYDLDALKRVGYRQLYRKINTLNFNSQRKAGGDGLKQQLVEFSEKMYQWFRFNDKFMQGTFVFSGSPVVTVMDKGVRKRFLEKVGMYLEYLKEDNPNTYVNKDDKISENNLSNYEYGRYYIHQIDYRYQYGESLYRVFHVSRGVPDNQELRKKIFVAKKYNSWKTAFDEGGSVSFEEKKEVNTEKPEKTKTQNKTKKEKRVEKMNKISKEKMKQSKGVESIHNHSGAKKKPFPEKKTINTQKNSELSEADQRAINAAADGVY